MRIDIVTIFPAWFDSLDLSLTGRARAARLVEIAVHDLRDWTHDRHRTVDDTPYGGGPGMVMKPEPWGDALDRLRGEGRPTLVVPTVDVAGGRLVVADRPGLVSGEPE